MIFALCASVESCHSLRWSLIFWWYLISYTKCLLLWETVDFVFLSLKVSQDKKMSMCNNETFFLVDIAIVPS